MRNPNEVLSQIKKHIPKKYHENFGIIETSREFNYRAPESSRQSFAEIHEYIMNVMEDDSGAVIPKKDWHYKICSILSEKTVEELKNYFEKDSE